MPSHSLVVAAAVAWLIELGALVLPPVALLGLAGCGGLPGQPMPVADPWFTDQAEASGLDFTHFNGASGRFYYPEILPPGVALLDYDNDGDLDAYLVQGRMLGANQPREQASIAPHPQLPLKGRLFRNDLQVAADGTRVLHFTDVTERSGISAQGYGMGVATGDVDNDGWVDLYLTNFGPGQLFRNQGDGTFAEVSRQSGIDDPDGFGVSASFLDFDRDGWLDLYVGNNVTYAIENETPCPNMAGERDYCPPQVYGGQRDRLYRNRGGGRFEDVTARALVGGKFGPALGVSAADFNGDGWVDIYVANDGTENLLWINQQDGTFKDTALPAGAAVNEVGRPEASMGVDAGDFDNDGDEDLFMTHLTGEGNNLYVNDGPGRFVDRSAPSGLGPLSLSYTGWGTAWIDFDNDGWLDLFTVNGTIVKVHGRARQPFPYDQKKLLFRNRGDGRFEDVTSRAGAAFELSEAGRGAACGDVDNDGDIDVLVGNNSGRARLLINGVGNRHHWLGLRLVGKDRPRDLVGAVVTVTRPGAAAIRRRARADGSYASAHDPRVLVGLGASAEAASLSVRWPDGRVETWSGVNPDRWTTITEGSGTRQ